MTKKDLIVSTVTLISEYYKGNHAPLMDLISDDFLWIGPRAGQMLKGKLTLQRAFAEESVEQTFEMKDLKHYTQEMGPDALEVMLVYDVITHFPQGNTVEHHQRLQCSWRLQYQKSLNGSIGQVWKIAMMHISNGLAKDDVNKIFASHPSDAAVDSVQVVLPDQGTRITVYAPDNSMHLIPPNQIMWGESCAQGKHCRLHLVTNNEVFECNERLSMLLERNSEYYLRVHSSFFVNPLYVRSCERYKIRVADGMELPIPEKKYRTVKEDLERWFNPKKMQETE